MALERLSRLQRRILHSLVAEERHCRVREVDLQTFLKAHLANVAET